MFALEKLKNLGIEVTFDNKEDLGSAEICGANDELIILDEADDFIFDSINIITAPNIVGLTATALDDLEDDAAADYLIQPRYMGFKVLESGIESDISMSSYTKTSVD